MNLRDFTNKLRGRRKVEDKSLNYDEALAILNSLDPNTTINLKFEKANSQINPLIEARVNVEYAKGIVEKFRPQGALILDAIHQVYRGKDERHYIDIEQKGRCTTRRGEAIETPPTMTVSMDYVVELVNPTR